MFSLRLKRADETSQYPHPSDSDPSHPLCFYTCKSSLSRWFWSGTDAAQLVLYHSPLPDAHPLDTASLISYLAAAVACLFSSAGWHVLSGCAARKWFEWGACVDCGFSVAVLCLADGHGPKLTGQILASRVGRVMVAGVVARGG
jgi:hypothetical protein